MQAKAAQSSASSSGSSSSTVVPGLPPVPAHLAPNPPDFRGYKLDPQPLPLRVIPLKQPLCTASGTADDVGAGSNPSPASFHAVSQKLKANQLAVLRSEDPAQQGAHAVYYCDHKGVWQMDPPSGEAGSAAAGAAAASSDAGSSGGSHCVYEFEEVESGDGLSFVAVAPCLLLLTRAGGRLTIFLALPDAGQRLSAEGADLPPLSVLFDGSPLSPLPLVPHHATISAAMLSASRDKLFVVLYEFWQERRQDQQAESKSKEAISFMHEGDALRSAGAVAPTPAQEGFSAISSDTNALHKLTAVQFNLRHISALGHPAVRNTVEEPAPLAPPSADLIHSFSSVQNYRLPKEDMPPQHSTDSQWSAPLACWLQLPPVGTQAASSSGEASAPMQPFLWFVAARVPYLNETESVVHEIERRRIEQDMDDKQARLRDRADEMGTEALSAPGIGSAAPSVAASSSSSAAAAGPGQPRNPAFTSEEIVSSTHNLKHYAIDNEDDDEDMDETGLADPSKYSLNRTVDVQISLFDSLGYLLARRPVKGATFLFGHVVEPVVGGAGKSGKRTAVIGVKQLEALSLYEVSAAVQTDPVGLSMGAAGAVPRPDSAASSSSPRLGLVFTPLFSFAGLGYVQSGKPHKKFFLSNDGPLGSFITLAEYTRLVYVYGRPQKGQLTAPQYLLQLSGDDEDEGQQIYGLQSVLVPVAQTAAAAAAAPTTPGPNAREEKEPTPQQVKPLLYVLTRHACRQFQLPLITLCQPSAKVVFP